MSTAFAVYRIRNFLRTVQTPFHYPKGCLASSHPSSLHSPQCNYIPRHTTGKEAINSYDFLRQLTMSTCVPPDQCPAKVRIIYKEMGGMHIYFLPCWIAPKTSFFPLFFVLNPHRQRANYSRNAHRWRRINQRLAQRHPAMDHGLKGKRIHM